MPSKTAPEDKKPDKVVINKALLKDEYIGPTGYALGKTAGLLFVVGTVVTALYYVAFCVFKNGEKSLTKPYELYLKVKNPAWGWVVKNVLGKMPFESMREYARGWTYKIVPERIDDHTRFLIASSVGALVGKILSIPSYIRFKHEAHEINKRTAKRNETIKEQAAVIDQLHELLVEQESHSEKPVVTFAKDKTSHAGVPYTERTASAAEYDAQHAL